MTKNTIEQCIMNAIPHDKALHAIAGVILFAAGALYSVPAGLGLALTGGLAKEVYDHFTGGDVSWQDVAFTCAGGGLGLLSNLA